MSAESEASELTGEKNDFSRRLLEYFSYCFEGTPDSSAKPRDALSGVAGVVEIDSIMPADLYSS